MRLLQQNKEDEENALDDSLSNEQNVIKNAVISDSGAITQEYGNNESGYAGSVMGEAGLVPAPQSNQFEGMQPSMMSSEKNSGGNYQTPYPSNSPPEQYQQPYPAYPEQQSYDNSGGYYDYGFNQTASMNISSETITEIAEQIASEKVQPVAENIEKIIEFRDAVQTKVDMIEEKLKRIEEILDKLQISVLQKVGDYVNDVTDIKKELIETQKSFKSLLPEIKKSTHKTHSLKKSHRNKNKKKKQHASSLTAVEKHEHHYIR